MEAGSALQTLAKYGDIRCCSGSLRPPVFRRSESAATTNDRHHNLQSSIGVIRLSSVGDETAQGFFVAATRARSAERDEPSVFSSDSFGILVTKGLISHPSPVGILR